MSKPSKRKWDEISDILNEKGMEAAFSGEVNLFKFDYEGSPINLKVVRLDRKRRKVWVEQIDLYTQDEFDVVDNEPLEGEVV